MDRSSPRHRSGSRKARPPVTFTRVHRRQLVIGRRSIIIRVFGLEFVDGSLRKHFCVYRKLTLRSRRIGQAFRSASIRVQVRATHCRREREKRGGSSLQSRYRGWQGVFSGPRAAASRSVESSLAKAWMRREPGGTLRHAWRR